MAQNEVAFANETWVARGVAPYEVPPNRLTVLMSRFDIHELIHRDHRNDLHPGNLHHAGNPGSRAKMGNLGRHGCCAAAMAMIPFAPVEGQFLDAP
jgi:hypothetical protein